MKVCPNDKTAFHDNHNKCTLCGTGLTELSNYRCCPKPVCERFALCLHENYCKSCGTQLVVPAVEVWAEKLFWPALTNNLRETLARRKSLYQKAEKIGISRDSAESYIVGSVAHSRLC